MKTKRLCIAIAASLALHAAVPASVETIKVVAPKFKDLIERVDSEIDKMKIERARKKLIAKARKDIKNGEFNLGTFILDAERIDAEEQGEEYKYEEALEKLGKKISELQDLLKKGHKVQEAVPNVLSEFDYYGFSMGSTGDAIIENGGNCEAISHYIASIVHGTGYEENIYFRRYGPGESGSGHIAPIFVDDGVEYDLAAGNHAQIKGVRFRPEKLVDFYAIKHGLGEGEIIDKNSVVASAGSFSYPHTDEPFSEGSAPIFAQHGVKEFKPTNNGLSTNDELYKSRYYLNHIYPNYKALNLVPYRFNHLEPDCILVEPIYEKEENYIDRLMSTIEYDMKLLQTIDKKPERIMQLARLSGLYFDAYHQLSLLGKTAPAKEAFKHREEVIKEAEKIFESIENPEKFAKQLMKISIYPYQAAGRMDLWYLVYLGEDGADFLFNMMHPGVTYDEYTYLELEESLMTLLIFPPTRERAEKKMKEWMHTGYVERYYDVIDIPHENMKLDELQWVFGLCGASYNVELDIIYDYPPASRMTFEIHPELLPHETEAPEFRKLLKSIEKESRRYGDVDDECKKEMLLELGTVAVWSGRGFYPEITGPLHPSEHDAELKFAKEFKEWLDDTEFNDPKAKKTAEFMKEHIKKKYGF